MFKSLDLIRKFRVVAIALLALSVVFVSCSKEEEEELLNSMGGDLMFDLTPYAYVGDVFELTAYGITTPIKDSLKYSWYAPDMKVDTLAVDRIRITIPDSLATFSVSLNVTATDYYGRSYSTTVTAVDPRWNGSLTNLAIPKDSIMDARDNQWYHIVKIGNLDWFAENLNWGGAGASYANSKAAADIFGRYYTWEDATGGVSASGLGAGAQGVCPDGWSIPTNEDWLDLVHAVAGNNEAKFEEKWANIANDLVGEIYMNGKKIWGYSPYVFPTNKYGWNALPSGSCYDDYSQFKNMNSYGMWWSCTQNDNSTAFYRYIYKDYPDVAVATSTKNALGVSVRCVRLSK